LTPQSKVSARASATLTVTSRFFRKIGHSFTPFGQWFYTSKLSFVHLLSAPFPSRKALSYPDTVWFSSCFQLHTHSVQRRA
jgi:hypothetical protein